MARKKMPARYKSGPKKGQFKPKASRNAPSKKRRSSTKKGGVRKTARRAYMKSAANPPYKKRKARKNTTQKQLMSVILWSSITAFGQGVVKGYIGKLTNSPVAANYGTIAAVGWLGFHLTKKVRTQPAGYAVMGVAFAKLASEIGSATGLFESGAGFVPKSQVMQRLPNRVSIPSMNPVGRIVVPS